MALALTSCAGFQQAKHKRTASDQQALNSSGEPDKTAAKKNNRHKKRTKKSGNPNGGKFQEVDLNKSYFKGYVTDTAHILTSPVRWDGGDWMKAALVLGTTGAFFAADDDIREFAQDNRSAEKDRLSDVFTPFGDGRYVAPALAVYYLQGYAFENLRSKRAALLGLESFAVTGLFTTVLKYGTGRDRPNTGNDAESWNGPGSIKSYAFPSGHTSTAFAIATAFAAEYQDEPLVPPLAYGIAAMTGLSRINDNKHWASDVFFGAALGYFTTKTIYKLHQDKRFGRFALYPRANERETGLTFAYRY